MHVHSSPHTLALFVYPHWVTPRLDSYLLANPMCYESYKQFIFQQIWIWPRNHALGSPWVGCIFVDTSNVLWELNTLELSTNTNLTWQKRIGFAIGRIRICWQLICYDSYTYWICLHILIWPGSSALGSPHIGFIFVDRSNAVSYTHLTLPTNREV